MHSSEKRAIAKFLAAGPIALVLLISFRAAPCRAGVGEQAKAKFEEGTTAVKSGDYERALEAFEESYELKPKPQVLYNVAMCQKALLRYCEAIDSFRRLVNTSNGAQKTELESTAIMALAELESAVGNLDVIGAPKGSTIILDGRVRGIAPLSHSLCLDPGEHTFLISADGYTRYEKRISSKPGTTIEAIAIMGPLGDDDAPQLEEAPAPTGDEPAIISESSDLKSDELSKSPTRDSRLLVFGFVTTCVGVGAGGVGLFYNIKWRQDLDEADAYDGGQDDNEVIVDRVWMITGYSVGAAMVLTGITLFILYDISGERTDDIALLPTANGFKISF